ncbi:hypothetical protein ACET3Z_030899 [Daucus carota]
MVAGGSLDQKISADAVDTKGDSLDKADGFTHIRADLYRCAPSLAKRELYHWLGFVACRVSNHGFTLRSDVDM